jgi:ACS family sodium-dependent inorganic phosphate cotransporter
MHFVSSALRYLLLSWLPKYMVDVVGTDLKKSGLLLMLPYAVPFLASNASGHIADGLIKRGLAVGRARKIMQTIAFVGPATCLVVLMNLTDPSAGKVSFLMAGALGFGAFSHSGDCKGTLL